jgi:type I restriction-modification system DNA methylase subunit
LEIRTETQRRGLEKMVSESELRPVERTFYPPIMRHLEDIGFLGIQEIRKGKDYADILFEAGRNRFLLEVKLDRNETGDALINGIVQIHEYSLNYNTHNLIVIVFPKHVADELSYLAEVSERALKSKVEAVILTGFWHDYTTKLTIEDILGNLKAKIDQNISSSIRIGITSVIIRKGVIALSRIILKHYKNDADLDSATRHLMEDYGLFVKFGTSKISESRKRYQTIDLLSYILVNQILFYFLYAKRSKNLNSNKQIPELQKISSLADLESYFDHIRAIDYKPIFDILVVQRIPPANEVIDQINKLIECLIPLQVEEVKHDLYGRLIGNSLPKETRKSLASYYTKTSSADLLANLSIDEYSNSVWDLACGSGTLLVASYDRKLRLYRKEKRFLEQADEDKLHVKFVEQELTGTDIMPFACHLTGLNLSAKNLRAHTDFLRISKMNTLTIESLDEPLQIKEAYGDISAELQRLQLSQKTFEDYVPKAEKSIQPKSFKLDKVDRILVNPPFTGINRLPLQYRKAFTSSVHSHICGKRINLWGYFLALADKALKEGGKIGAIIPINLLHGDDTLKLRRFILENYCIDYIVKPSSGKSFSEDTDFKDMIIVARRVKPDRNTRTRIICLKVDIDEYGSPELEALSKDIKTQLEEVVDDQRYLSFQVLQSELLNNPKILMRYVFTNNLKVKVAFDSLIANLGSNSLATNIKRNAIEDGYQLRPKGTANNNVICMQYSEARTKRSLLVFKKDEETHEAIQYHNTRDNINKSISKSKLVKTFRTLTGVDVIDSSQIYDFLMKDKATQKRESNLFLSNRFRLNTNETYSLATYRDDAICPLNSFVMFFCESTDAKILSLYFNSIFYIIQVLMLTKQSTGAYLEIRQADLENILVPDLDKLDKEKRKILSLFEELRLRRIDSIISQLKGRPEYRLKIDLTMAEVLGVNMSKSQLETLYALALLQIEATE